MRGVARATRTTPRSGLFITPALMLMMMLTGCGNEDMSDLRRYIEEVKGRPGGEIEPIPKMEPFTSYSYPESPGRSPFATLSFAEPREEKEQQVATGPKPDRTRPKETLEQFELDSLSYVGTLEQDGETWGLVKDPGGTVHRVQGGNYLGTNYGKITAIKPNAIELRELVSKPQGGWTRREASLALND